MMTGYDVRVWRQGMSGCVRFYVRELMMRGNSDLTTFPDLVNVQVRA